MAMEARLQLRQTQRLVMTPMLQQAIQLLQLSTIELQELLQKELTENPVLEEASPEEDPAAERPDETGETPLPEGPDPSSTAGDQQTELPFDIAEIIFGPPEERTLVQQEDHDDTRFENFVGTTTSLSDHLMEQLRLSAADGGVRQMAEYLIGNVDDDGYIPATLIFDKALELVQACDPPGVGARTLHECCCLQTRRRPDADPLALEIVEQHFAAVAEYDGTVRGSRGDAERAQDRVGRIAWSVRDLKERLLAWLADQQASPLARMVVTRQFQAFQRYVDAGLPGKADAGRAAERVTEMAKALDVPEGELSGVLTKIREGWEAHVVATVARLAALERQPGRHVPPTDSLATYVSKQVARAAGWPDVAIAVSTIIGHLGVDGYLQASLEELAEKTALPLFDQALALVQRFDPPGVGARSIREGLLNQLREQETPDPVALEILDQHFDAFQRCRYQEIARALKVDQERVLEAVDEIAALEPKPGRRFAAAETRYVVPDVYVHKVDDDYAIVLNDDGIPRLRINAYYRSMIGRAQGDEARRYVEDRLRSAIWLIKSVHQRQKTLYKVTESIVRFQRAFLDQGTAFLRPLSLRHVAEDIQMHESTVSRVTTNKYVQTPQGLFELKFFFHSGISREHGDEVSSVSVKKMIGELVAQEHSGKPLSDQDITRLLKQRGLNIARRTVAKYREELGVLPSHQRRLAIRKRS